MRYGKKVKEKQFVIPIWKARDKFDNPSRGIYGERLRIILRKPENRINHQLVFIREFKDFLKWNRVDENGCCVITVNSHALDKIIEKLESIKKILDSGD